MDSKRGSLQLGPGESAARYLLLHTEGETKTGKLFKIVKKGPKVYSRENLIKKGYPTEPSQPFYLVYEVDKSIEEEFHNRIWDITKLSGYKTGRGSVLPFSTTLAELMKVAERNE